MTDQTAKKRENKVLRRNEYYAIQDVFDDLYARSKQGGIFTDLMSLIASPQNIALAYRRIMVLVYKSGHEKLNKL